MKKLTRPNPLYPLIVEVVNLCEKLSDLPIDGAVSYEQAGDCEFYERILSDAYKLGNTRLKLVSLIETSQEDKHYKLSSKHATGVAGLLAAGRASLCFIDNSETQHKKTSIKRLDASERLTIYLREQGREDLCWIVVTILDSEDFGVRHVYGQRIMRVFDGDLKVAGLLDRLIP